MFKQFLVGAALLLFGLSSYGADMAKGKALSAQCSVCHGKNGIAKDPESPNLAGLSSLYIEKTIVDYQKGLREDRRMSIIAQSLSMEDIKDLAAWYSAFELTVKEPSM
jgi:cytochrome c553